MTTYSIDTFKPQRTCWHTLNRSTPDYRDMLPLPHAVPPKDRPLVLDFLAQRKGASPLQISRLDYGRCVGGYRTRVLEWLYHLAGVLAPAQLISLRAELYPDDDPMPSLPAVQFRELGASMWQSVTFPALFDNYPADFYLSFSAEVEESGVVVRPEAHLARVGPEAITGPLEGLAFVDEAMEQAQLRWQRFCDESCHWLLDCGITHMEIKGSTATVSRR
ncbi:hypothetical protein AAFN88_12145 [Pelagibius sp. CAU 1746]|uniref:hypothetical protein n=1 Tax=Pelagibius sp. CAU 1746 TaxID=3140370 RepID=UPI00325B7BC0